MNALYSLFAATGLAAADLAALVMLVNALGRKLNPGRVALLAIFLAGKLAFLGLAVFWLSKAPWFHLTGATAGLLFPFAAFALWQGLKLSLARKGASA